jgi:hypothetical protein
MRDEVSLLAQARRLRAWCYACRRSWILSEENYAELGDVRQLPITGNKKAPMPKHRGHFVN